MPRLRILEPRAITAGGSRGVVDAATLAAAAEIVDAVREGGEPALRAHAERLDDLGPGAPLVVGRDALLASLDALDRGDRVVLERTAERIETFARAQLGCLEALHTTLPGGTAGHTIAPVDTAGCYAPGGRYPLPSSVLMTALTARVAGVATVWVASPRPAEVTRAAAAIAGADALLAAGGAHAIAALAFGAGPVPACDAVVGPGNRWVTAAKQLVAGHVAIDLLAGPSELVVLADASADAATVAADLLAQAEHDVHARPILVSVDAALVEAVQGELDRQLADLPTAEVAAAACSEGFAVVCAGLDEAVAIVDRLAPEHLQVMTSDAREVAFRCHHYGAVFIGPHSAEVLGDYGAGPNHTLPTGGSARSGGGLSVFDFLRVRTWLEMEGGEDAREIVEDAVHLARLEGLEAHARAAELRLER